ncbi:hypothetical protein GALL_399010 [mine drainage metagenome]|uniref:Uncharacterized protein n=1 Tax=mine drainage metagenome TaxID=410659 RepID=A0A1J5QR30_9ZZZZ
MESEESAYPDFEELFERPKTPGQRQESVGMRLHDCFTRPHVVDDDQFVRESVCYFHLNQCPRNHANRVPAAFSDTSGNRTHHGDIAAA